MAKVMESSEPFPRFPPSDRELALRAQIKTGWSTHSSTSYDCHQHGLTDHEVKLIKEVVEKAQAIERMEEIRIGLLMLKHKQMIENCRGDGVSTCRICDHDFTHQRSSRPDPIQHCHDCCMVICRRCEIKNPRKIPGGDEHTLCVVCYEERELWKKSGAWLVHSVPHMSIPYADLEEIQQQRIKNAKVALGFGPKREVEALVNPYQLEVEDSDDDSMLVTSSSIKSQFHFSKSQNQPATLQPKSSPWFPSDSKPRSHSLEQSNFGTKSSSDSEDQQTISQAAGFSRRSGLSRKGAMVAKGKNRLQQYRERSHSPSASASNSRRNSSSSNSETSATDHDGGGSSTLNGHLPSIPSIEVSKIPSNHPLALTAQFPSSRSTSPESDAQATSKHGLIHQKMHLTSSIDSDSIQVSSDAWRPETVSAITEEIQNENKTSTEQLGPSSSVGSDHASPVLKKKGDAQPYKTLSEEMEDIRTYVDDFKKMKCPPPKLPPQGKFGSGVGATDQGSIDKQDIKFNADSGDEDEFKKVKSSPVRQEAEVKKMSVPTFTTAGKRELSGPGSVAVGGVGEFKEDRDSKSIDGEEDLFKKISVFSSDTKPVAKARRNVLPSEPSVGSPSVPPPSGPPLRSPRPHGPPPPGPSAKKHPQGSLIPAQATVQEENSIITESTFERTPARVSLTRRNATRVSRNKRPPPRPNVGDKDKEEQPLDGDENREDTGKLRARSKVLKGRRPQGIHGNVDAAENSSPPMSRSFEEREDVDGRSRATSATSHDKINVSVAVLETSSKREGEVSDCETKWKPDGES